MTISLPSHEIYAVDIPEVTDFVAEFKYNFFVNDESVNESGEVPEHVLLKSTSNIDSEYIQYSTSRIPRIVTFKFTHPSLITPGNEVSDSDRKNISMNDSNQTVSIQENIDKITTEDHFSSHNFIAVNFHDAEIHDKIHFLVTGSIISSQEESDQNITLNKSSYVLNEHTPNDVSFSFLSRALKNKKLTQGIRLYRSSDVNTVNTDNSRWYTSRRRNTKHSSRSYGGKSQVRLKDRFFARLHHVNINTQINTRALKDLVNKGINDANNQHSDDMFQLSRVSDNLQNYITSKSRLQITERDYKTIVPFINVRNQISYHTNRQPSKIIGYIIDKTEITEAPETIEHPPIIIENPLASISVDFKVKYNSRYRYSIRTIAQLTLPAIDTDTNELAMITLLISSKPSAPMYIRCRETSAPPPPSDVNFTWDYDTEKLFIHWCFPVNSQRDIKKFQVFRRKTIDEPFQLLKMYDFNDSLVRMPNKEDPAPALIEFLTSPTTFYIDDDFKKMSKYIYAIASVDAHGFSSGYSAQFEVQFDQFKNVVIKQLVSHSGAPKPYPNLYLEADTFVDTIRVSGPSSKRMKLYFNPEYYGLTDDNEQFIRTIATKQQGGSYKIQVLNLDSQKSETISVVIDDLIKADSR